MTTTEQARDEVVRLTAERDAFLWRINQIERSQTDNINDLQTAKILRERVDEITAALANLPRML